jgi:hypothetical protein
VPFAISVFVVVNTPQFDEEIKMGLLDDFGLGNSKKVRYAIVGLGDIAQEDMMPA